jgi:thiamine biosynthesis lipoprotein
MNRRDFLQPRNLLRPAGQILGAMEEVRALVEETPAQEDAVLLRFARRAMATTFEVILPFGTCSAQDVAEACLDLVDRLEAQLTVYREDSEVSRLNRNAFQQEVRVESGLYRLLALCQQLAEETDGAFDVSVGALIKAWGFYRRAGRVPDPQELQGVRRQIGMRHLRLDPDKGTATLLRPGVEINLGSIGKGYSLDAVIALLRADWHVPAALVHGGHSSVYALGSEPGGTQGWTVGLLDPEDKERRLAVLQLLNRGMGTSAATYQHLEYQGRKLPHLLDPRTGWPAEGMLSATATAPTAAQADALATAFFVLGVEGARAYCAGHPDVGAVLVPNTPERQVIVLGRALTEINGSAPPRRAAR